MRRPDVGLWVAVCMVYGKISTATRRWLACVVPHELGIVAQRASWLAACQKAALLAGTDEAKRRLDLSVSSGLQRFEGELTSKRCKSLYWDRRKAFFGDEMKATCTRIEEKERVAKAIGTLTRRIEGYLKSKRYGKAYDLLGPLREAGASEWQLEQMAKKISSAQLHGAVTAQRDKEQRQAKALMRKLPSLERTCKDMFTRYHQAVKRIKQAVRAGNPERAEAAHKRKASAASRACLAQAKVYKVYHLYDGQGNSVAASEVLRAGHTCINKWRCE